MPGTSRSATAYPFDVPRIEIIGVPDGEAPAWVRRAWVGVILPLAVNDVLEWETFGVISGPKTRFFQWIYRSIGHSTLLTGYLVTAQTAVDVLEDTSPEAATWWRDHTPQMLDGVQTFLFQVDVCRRVKASPWSPAND